MKEEDFPQTQFTHEESLQTANLLAGFLRENRISLLALDAAIALLRNPAFYKLKVPESSISEPSGTLSVFDKQPGY